MQVHINKDLDHQQAVLDLHKRGYQLGDIAGLLVKAGYFKGNKRLAVLGKVRAILIDNERLPPGPPAPMYRKPVTGVRPSFPMTRAPFARRV